MKKCRFKISYVMGKWVVNDCDCLNCEPPLSNALRGVGYAVLLLGLLACAVIGAYRLIK